jgi:DNA-binding NarL/FixJ family response regulator
MAVRVVVAEDDYFVRAGLQRLLDGEPDIELVGAYETADALLASIADDRPDVVLTDIRMPPRGLDEGIVLAQELRKSHPDVGVVVLSNYAEPRHALRLFENGAEGRAYLLKQRVATRNGLARAITDVAKGGSAVDPNVVTALLDSRPAPGSPLAALTGREAGSARSRRRGAQQRANLRARRTVEGSRREARQRHLRQAGPRLRSPVSAGA